MRKLLSLLLLSFIGGLLLPAEALPAQAAEGEFPKVRPIRVSYQKSAGVPDFLPFAITIGSRHVTRADIVELRRIVNEIDFFNRRSRVSEVPPCIPDPPARYSLSVELDGRKHMVEWDVSKDRKDLQPLVQWVLGRFRPDRALKAGAQGDGIFLDIIGENEIPAVFPEFVPEDVWVLVKVKGKSYWLDLSGSPDFAAKVAKLHGKKVAVTGWLTHRPTLLPISKLPHYKGSPVIVVSSLESVKNDDAKPVIRAEIYGTLHHTLLQSWPPISLWEVKVNGQTYTVHFSNAKVETAARQLPDGQLVRVTGEWDGDRVIADSVEPRR